MMKDGCAKRHSLSMYNGHRAEPDARFLMYPTEQILETHPSRLSECRGQGTLEFTVREGQTQACHHGRVPSLGSGMRDRRHENPRPPKLDRTLLAHITSGKAAGLGLPHSYPLSIPQELWGHTGP